MADRDNYASVVTILFGVFALTVQFVLLFFWRIHDHPGKNRPVPASACSESYWHIIFLGTTVCVCCVVAVGLWLESKQAHRVRAAPAAEQKVKKNK